MRNAFRSCWNSVSTKKGIGQLNRANSAFVIPRRRAKGLKVEGRGELIGDTVAAVVALLYLRLAIGRSNSGTLNQRDDIGFLHRRAKQRGDRQPARAVRFGVPGVLPSHHVAGILND